MAIAINSPHTRASRAAAMDTPRHRYMGVHPTAVLGDGVIVGRTVVVGPHAVLGDGVILGDDVTIGSGCYIGEGTRIGSQTHVGAGVVIREFTTIGKRVRIESGVVIGSDGFGFAADAQGGLHKVPQVGTVEIGDDVTIGAGATIDRATMSVTSIGDRCRIGAHVMIGHNVVMASDVVVGPGSGIGGSAEIESGVQIGTKCGVIGHARIGTGARVMDFTGVSKSVPAGRTIVGHPNMTPEEFDAQQSHLAELPGLLQRIAALEKNTTQKASLL